MILGKVRTWGRRIAEQTPLQMLRQQHGRFWGFLTWQTVRMTCGMKRTDQGIKCSSIADTGILSADLFDYDGDGQEEILAIIIGTNSSQFSEQGYWFYMLERESDGSWIKAAEYLIDMGYHALDGIQLSDAHRLFLKSTGRIR